MMDSLERLNLLSTDMGLEMAEEAGCPQPRTPQQPFISQAVLPNGKRIRLLKTLLTSACESNCYYCPFRAGREFRRASFKPEELARTFMQLHRAGIADGAFLSSGLIAGGRHTQDLLLDTAEILRYKLHFNGYLHLKIMPGAEHSQVERAMQLADRVSINLEAPNQKRLELLAPRKDFFNELFQPIRWVEEIRQMKPPHLGWNGRWPSTTTQFVVGAAGESDLELLTTTVELYNKFSVRRAYYSAFRPIADTPLENLPAESPIRQQRLYQASFLLRDYGFRLEELPMDESGNLPRHSDPKLVWAQEHLTHNPIEINRADRAQLLRVPGIGPQGAASILYTRRHGHIHNLSDLSRLGINVRRAAPFILVNGKCLPYQYGFAFQGV